MNRRRLALTALGATAALAAGVAPVVAHDGDDDRDRRESATRTWDVTIENLTPAGSQPLSPPLLVVHNRRADVWSTGQIVSQVVAPIAEDANNSLAESALPQVGGVKSAVTGAGGPILPGESRTFTVETKGSFRHLSIVSMLVNTNDAFTGLDSLKLRGTSRTVMAGAYDAGSEKNNELKAFIPGPCCTGPGVRDPEGGIVTPHPGISGSGELSAETYGWTGPVAKISVVRR